jgi:hypothetical protein
MTAVRFPWRQLVLIALVVCGWAPFKVAWEVNIERQQDQLRYHGLVVTRQLRDQLSQGLTIGVLAGFRNIVADLVWLDVEDAWEKYQWFKMDSLITLATSLEPRSVTFWDYGGWQLAWNVAYMARSDVVHEPSKLRRMHDERFWMYRGLDVFKRGIENNPESYKLWERVGQLYEQKLGDYHMAAYYYEKASEQLDAPVYLERFPAIMLGKAGDYPAAYEAWKKLWFKLTPAQREEKQHWKEKIESSIRGLEKQLNIPAEKRVFPN